MKRTILSLFCILALLPAAYACLNDRDSDALAEEAQQLPDMVRVLTGRFERNPPRYYEMRLARVTKELQQNPNKLALYDDAAVAADRLHHDDEAIAWMAKKKARLGHDKEAIYRYHANLGTFLAHRWIGRKDRWNRLSEMKEARDHIARAVEIKPDAHFNRERYQLQVMQWILTRPNKESGTLKDYIAEETDWNRQAEGLSGLIVLGAAWESVDVTDALATTLRRLKHHKLSLLAAMRRNELMEAGKHSLMFQPGVSPNPEENLRGGSASYEITVPEGVKAKYVELRREADAWQKERTVYMETRFARGKHPDTDPDFWREWKPTAPPSLEIPGELEAQRRERLWGWLTSNPGLTLFLVLVAFPALLITGLVFGIRALVQRLAG